MKQSKTSINLIQIALLSLFVFVLLVEQNSANQNGGGPPMAMGGPGGAGGQGGPMMGPGGQRRFRNGTRRMRPRTTTAASSG